MSEGHFAVLGAGGLIGGHTCEALAALDLQVAAFGRPPCYPLNGAHKIRWTTGEFADADALDEVLSGARCVVHLLGTSVPAASNASPADDALANLVPTLRLLDRCVQLGVRRLVYVSSGGTIYGPQGSTPIPESAPTRPISAYGAGKLAIETFLEVYRHSSELDYRILRVSNVFGPRQRSDRPQGVVATFLERLLDAQPIQIWGDGSAVRDYVYVKDVAQAIVAAAKYDGSRRIFNVGSGVGRSILDVLNDLQAATASAAEVTFTPGRTSDIPVNVLDVALAHSELGWAAGTPWDAALAETIDWMSAQRRHELDPPALGSGPAGRA